MLRLTLVLVAVASVTPHASASELLYSMYRGSSTGQGEIPSEQLWPALYYLDSQYEVVAPVFETVLPQSPYPSIITGTASAATDPDFDDFIGLLTNETVETLWHGSWSSAGPKWGGGGTLEPDLREFVITHIEETIYVDQVSPGMDLNGNGIWTDWSMSGTYDFYGYPIPEPTTGLFLLAGAFVLRRRR
ncbi:MAG: PEP-CTERM sorting domain-containing protein [Phycisphaerales bacterium]|mgnify:CR=1 FL=1|nr:PEP-CTERM sorting domain-containing protein [Phycisphaerales bacterium]